MVNAMFVSTGLSHGMWGKAIISATYLLDILVKKVRYTQGYGYKWIFKNKMKADGTIAKHKARLVIKEFRQREGLDYFDTYSPVTRITSTRMVLAIAALRNLEVHLMDVKPTFLNGNLEEEIYMNQPQGFIAPGLESKVAEFKDIASTQILEAKCISQRKVQRVTPTYPMQDSTVEPVYVQNRVSVNEISSLKEGKYVRSGCTTALNIVPWETDDESVLREACPTRASFHDLLLFFLFIVHSVCLLLLPNSV
ncbi:isochorismate synthase, chloroplastic [Tanacetum coccineum]